MKASLMLAALVPLLFLAADRPKKGTPQSDLDKLRGAWSVVSGESNGKPAPEDAFKEARMTFEGDKLTATSENVKSTENARSNVLSFKIDPSPKLKTIDITHPEKKQTILGIYVLEGDQLKLCLGTPGGARPTAFATKEGSGAVLFILKREK